MYSPNQYKSRPQHGMYEDILPLFACAVLPALSIALANDAFRDFHDIDSIFAIPPPIAGATAKLKFRSDILQLPFFQSFTVHGPTGKIEKANSFSNRTVS